MESGWGKDVFMQAYPLLARGPPLWGQDGGQGEERGRVP